MRMTHEKGGGIIRIGIADTRSDKAGRDRISGIMRYAAAHENWHVRIISSRDSITATANETIDDEKLNAIIGPMHVIKDVIVDFPLTIPIVCINSKSDALKEGNVRAHVDVDNAAIGTMAADIFIKSGLRNLAFAGVRQPIEQKHQQGRMEAFRKAASAAGIPCEVFIPAPHGDSDDDIADLAKWLKRLSWPCGVMAYSDSCAQTVLDACHMVHLRVPDQIQLIGVDNEVEICENLQPTLTSILPDFEGGGYLAAKLLDDILSRRIRPRKPVMRSHGVKTVVVRASTQDLKGGGRIVTHAKEFIRLHAGERIGVSDVAKALSVSRRTIENRFREVLERGVAEVLRQERLERVCRLLRETDRTIADIALDSGFASPTHLSAAFKRFTGTTMRAWRKFA